MVTTGTRDNVLTTVLATRWKATSGKFCDLASVFPDGRLDSEMVSGTRTCGDMLRHVAYWHRYIADSLNGREGHESANELPSGDYPDKARILEELEKTNNEIANGMHRNLDAKTLELYFKRVSLSRLNPVKRARSITGPGRWCAIPTGASIDARDCSC